MLFRPLLLSRRVLLLVGEERPPARAWVSIGADLGGRSLGLGLPALVTGGCQAGSRPDSLAENWQLSGLGLGLG